MQENPIYNHIQYYKSIINKCKESIDYENIILQPDDSIDKYLSMYESINVYSTYPTPIIMPLKKSGETYNIDLQSNTHLTINLLELEPKIKILNDAIIKFNVDWESKFKELQNTEKVRRFFDYELRDEIRSKLNNNNISNAWIKMYELLNTYSFFGNNKNINTFHICEHPGGFIHAIKYFVTKKLGRSHNFVFQSLKPENDPQIFKPDKELIKKYSQNLDYGPAKGDITNNDTIKYYYDKYNGKYFDLITSDCGLDCSDDFTTQEENLNKIFLGALITAIGISSNGTNYVFKMFSFNNIKTIELLQIACLFYERVDIVRVLSTKSGSGENYCVCLNYNYKYNKNEAINKLINYLQNNNDTFILNKFEDKFVKRIIFNSDLINMRRICSLNGLIFRTNNYEYVRDHPIIMEYVKNYAMYYAKYFMIYIKLI